MRILEPLRHQFLLRQKERRKTQTSTGLPTYQQMDQKKPKCISTNSPSHRPITRMHTVHQGGRQMGIQQHPNQGGRRMESCLPNPRRTIRTNGNVLWTYELARHLPNDDEHHLPHQSRSGMAIHIHGRHRNPYQTRKRRNGTTTLGTPSTLYPPYASQARTKRLIPQT